MLAAAPILLLAQAVALPPVPSITPVRTEKAPDLDDDLSDAVWAKAAATSGFTQKFPNEGSAPSERTTLRFLYDDEALYIGFDVEQRDVPASRGWHDVIAISSLTTYRSSSTRVRWGRRASSS